MYGAIRFVNASCACGKRKTYVIKRCAVLCQLYHLDCDICADLQVKILRHADLWETELAVVFIVAGSDELEG